MLIVLLFVNLYESISLSDADIEASGQHQGLDWQPLQDRCLKLIHETEQPGAEVIFGTLKRPEHALVVQRDPFKRPFGEPARNRVARKKSFSRKPRNVAARNPTLNGIIWEAKAPAAVINNKMVRVGDRVHSFKVERISENKVVLTARERTLILQLPVKKLSSK